ncbi:MAG: hypothetical protein ABSG44_15320 [Thermodesulfobacteriota bacterium]|jgi:hypothetical protein
MPELTIDPNISRLLPPEFVRSEVTALNARVRVVRLNNFLYYSKKGIACYDPETQEILLDPNVPASKICERINLKHPFLKLQENEAWIYEFYHELFHASRDPYVIRGEEYGDEWGAGSFARDKIFELRKRGVQFCRIFFKGEIIGMIQMKIGAPKP